MQRSSRETATAEHSSAPMSDDNGGTVAMVVLVLALTVNRKMYSSRTCSKLGCFQYT